MEDTGKPEKVVKMKKKKSKRSNNCFTEKGNGIGHLPKEVVAVAGSGTGYLKQLASTIPKDILPFDEYLPEFVKDYASGGSVNRADALLRDEILCCKLERVMLYDRDSDGVCVMGKESLFLLIGYMEGFQIWDVTDETTAIEIASLRKGFSSVSICHFIRDPDDSLGLINKYNAEDDARKRTIDSSRPLVALCSPRKNFVKFYSLKLHQIAQELTFDSPVSGVQSNDKIVAISCHDKIYGYSSHTLDQRFILDTYPNPMGCSVFSLCDRWIAYSGPTDVVGTPVDMYPNYQNYDDYDSCSSSTLLSSSSPTTISSSTNMTPSSSGGSSNGMDYRKGEKKWTKNIASAARDIAAGIYYLGDLGYSKFEERNNHNNHNHNNDTSNKTDRNGDDESDVDKNGHHDNYYKEENFPKTGMGSVMIRDLITNVTIANFESHDSPLCLLQFDPTGSLLVTSSLEGQIIHIHKILPRNAHDLGTGVITNMSYPSHKLLYRLNRGITRVVIRQVTFSSDLRWLAVTSARGTTHLFPMSPCGGPISTYTHPTVSNNHNNHQNDDDLEEYHSPKISSSLGSLDGMKERIAKISSSFSPSITNHNNNKNNNNNNNNEGSSQPSTKTSFSPPVVYNGIDVVTLSALQRVRQKLVGPTIFGANHTKQIDVPAAVSAIFRGGYLNVVSSCGMMEQFELVPKTGLKDPRELVLTTIPTNCWDICRRKSWIEWKQSIITSRPYPKAPHRYKPKNTTTTQKEQDNDEEETKNRAKWLSNVEIHTHVAPLAHIWATPQFTFNTFDEDQQSNQLFVEQLNTTVVQVRGAGPLPSFNDEYNTKQNIQTAIATPAQFQDLYIPDNQEIDQHVLVFDDDLDNELTTTIIQPSNSLTGFSSSSKVKKN